MRQGWLQGRLLLFLVIALSVSGCMMPLPQPTPAAGPPVQVDLAKWSSGMYPDLYVDKRVVAEGYYIRPNMGQGDYRQGAPISFAIGSAPLGYGQNPPRTQAEAEAYSKQFQNVALISASAPLAMRDQVFGLQNGTRVRVSGVARQTGVFDTLWGRQYMGVSGLMLEANSIEPY